MKTRYLLLASGLLLLVLALVFLPQIASYYSLFWGKDALQRLFYEDFHWSEAQSELAGIILALGFPLATLWFIGWGSWRFFAGRAKPGRAARFVVGYLFIFALVPSLHVYFDSIGAPDACFNQRTGQPIKWYVAGAGGVVELYDSAGYDKLGNQKLPVTQEVCDIFAREQNGIVPKQIVADVSAVQFFDPTSGAPKVWYSQAADGSTVLYDGRGFDPKTSKLLAPVTADVVEMLKAKAVEQQKAAESRPAPPRTVAGGLADIQFFDPMTGAAKVWYSDNGLHGATFFDGPGYDPATGAELKQVTTDVLRQMQESAGSSQDATPPEPPKAITGALSDIQFFDPATGEAKVWFGSSGPDGLPKFFSGPGFDPTSGVKLQQVTAEDLSRFKAAMLSSRPKEEVARVPKRLGGPASELTFFDPSNGAPIIWYAHTLTGLEFFDAPGFDPTNGDKLLPVTKSLVATLLSPAQSAPKPSPAPSSDSPRVAEVQPLSTNSVGKVIEYSENWQRYVIQLRTTANVQVGQRVSFASASSHQKVIVMIDSVTGTMAMTAKAPDLGIDAIGQPVTVE
jgi:hypothetical protein